MRRALGRLVVVSAVGAVGLLSSVGPALAATPQSPGPEPGSPEQMAYFADTCRQELQRPPIGGVDNVTSPGPGRAVAGDSVDVNLRWDPADWNDTWVEKVLNCVSVDGTPVPELSAEERPSPNDGSYERELAVPADIGAGHLLCEQGFVFGVLSRGGYSQTSSPRVCFTTEEAPPPPPPTTTTTAPPTTTTTAAPKPAAAPAPRAASGVPAPPPPAPPAPVKVLPRTGPHDRLLLLGAGAALAAGGLGVAAGARRRRASLRL